MIETLLGSLFGGIFRMAPEVLKWLDRKDDRKHELSMFDKQLEADKWCKQVGKKVLSFEAGWLLDTYVKSAEAFTQHPLATFQFQPQIKTAKA